MTGRQPRQELSLTYDQDTSSFLGKVKQLGGQLHSPALPRPGS